MVGVVVIPQPGANHIEIANAVYDRMEKMKKDLPEDVHYNYGFDNTKFIRASIDEVKQTVYEAFVLVIIIIFLFLRDWRVTLVPCIVIPVSLIGAFFVMYLAGFSINVLSMLAVVLAVGLVVDDAIVMTENIYVRIEKGMPPKEAGIEGAKEIFFAVISTTITLVAVFFPIVFMDGTTGRLFREFSIVVSGSVIISSFAALTFTPMLATKLLIKREQQSWFYRKTEPFFEGMNRVYSQSLAAFLKRRWIALPFTIVTILLIGVLWNTIPAEMAPLEDRSQISINTMGAEGVTYEYIRDYTEDINHLVDSKGSAAFVLMAILIKVFAPMIHDWQEVLYWVTIASITIANIFAIRQQNLKRLMAFSSISQAADIMLGVIGGTVEGLTAMVYYILVYAAANLGVFAVITIVALRSQKFTLEDYAGLYKTNPKMAFLMTISLFSLAGIPPFAGFFSKFFIFMAAFEAGFHLLVFIALVNTVISLYYYLLIVKAMYITPSDNPIPTFRSDRCTKWGLALCTLGIIGLGIASIVYQSIDKLSFGI